MDANQVGYRYQLRAGEDQDCDDCNKRAVVRITEKSGLGTSFGYYCKSCMPEPASTPAPQCRIGGVRTA